MSQQANSEPKPTGGLNHTDGRAHARDGAASDGSKLGVVTPVAHLLGVWMLNLNRNIYASMRRPSLKLADPKAPQSFAGGIKQGVGRVRVFAPWFQSQFSA